MNGKPTCRLWYIGDVPETKPVIGAGDADRDARTVGFCVRGGDAFFSIIRGELSDEESLDPRMYPSSLLPSYCPERSEPSLSCGELFTEPNCSVVSLRVQGCPVVFVGTYEAILVQQLIVGLRSKNRLLGTRGSRRVSPTRMLNRSGSRFAGCSVHGMVTRHG